VSHNRIPFQAVRNGYQTSKINCRRLKQNEDIFLCFNCWSKRTAPTKICRVQKNNLCLAQKRYT